jgi:hypothetical protein
MADFLRREFYLPILNSARAHYGGMSHLSDKGGVTVNNLLGDALSMSGKIEALTALAMEIRHHLARYERQLQQSVNSEAVNKAVRAIEEEFAAKARSPNASAAQLASDKEAALARARGEGLEAGVFVSFGPAPLVVTIDDEVFGRSRVAIADRINESARGTARSGSARAKQDAMLAAERAKRNDPSLAHPWSVFTGAPFVLNIPVALEERAKAAMRKGDPMAAMRALADPVRQALEEAAKAGDKPGDIYNAGAALSDEALTAFQEAVAGSRVFRTLDVAVSSLHAEIQRRYFFPEPTVRLVLGYHPDGRLAEIFRFAGKVLFKGLEKSGGIGVWEVVGELGIGALLAQHHAAHWFRAVP